MRGTTSVSFGNTVLTFNSLIVGCRETHIKPCVGRTLKILIDNRNTFVSRDRLYNQMYEDRIDGGPDSSIFRVTISNARMALRQAGSDSWIEGERGRGYRLVGDCPSDTDVRVRYTRTQFEALQSLVRHVRPSLPRLADLVAAAVETPEAAQ